MSIDLYKAIDSIVKFMNQQETVKGTFLTKNPWVGVVTGVNASLNPYADFNYNGEFAGQSKIVNMQELTNIDLSTHDFDKTHLKLYFLPGEGDFTTNAALFSSNMVVRITNVVDSSISFTPLRNKYGSSLTNLTIDINSL